MHVHILQQCFSSGPCKIETIRRALIELILEHMFEALKPGCACIRFEVRRVEPELLEHDLPPRRLKQHFQVSSLAAQADDDPVQFFAIKLPEFLDIIVDKAFVVHAVVPIPGSC